MSSIFSIWLKPKQTYKYLSEKDAESIKTNIDYLFLITAVCLLFPGITDLLKLVDINNTFGYIIGLLIISVLGLLIFKFVYSFLIWIISKLLNGKASIFEIRLVLAYSLIPSMLFGIIGIILIIPALLTDNINLIFYRHPITMFVVWLFTVRNLIFGLSFFNKFSYGFAVLNLVIPIAILEAIVILKDYL